MTFIRFKIYTIGTKRNLKSSALPIIENFLGFHWYCGCAQMVSNTHGIHCLWIIFKTVSRPPCTKHCSGESLRLSRLWKIDIARPGHPWTSNHCQDDIIGDVHDGLKEQPILHRSCMCPIPLFAICFAANDYLGVISQMNRCMRNDRR